MAAMKITGSFWWGLSIAAMIIWALNSYDVYVRISRDASNSTHNSTGLRKEGLNSRDYSLSLFLSLPLSLSLSHPIFQHQMLSFQSLLL